MVYIIALRRPAKYWEMMKDWMDNFENTEIFSIYLLNPNCS